MNDGKIYITISDERGKSIPTDVVKSGGSVIKKEDKEEKSLFDKLINHQFYTFTLNSAKQMANYVLGNIGNFAGDFYTQRSVNEIKKIGGVLASIGAGFMAGGVVGGLIATAGVVMSEGISYQMGLVGNIKQNYEISQLREISGLNGLTNGSR